MPDALQLLRDDHRIVQDLFREFEHTDDRETKAAIVKKALDELDVHAEVEERIFYPAVRKEVESDEDGDMMDEAEEEHHVVHVLIAELRRMRPSDKRYNAKFTVLAENVKHHIQEEETEMLPKAAEQGSEVMTRLGQQMMKRKEELMSQLQRAGTLSADRRRKTTARRTTTSTRSPRRPSTRATRPRATTRRTRTAATRTRTASRNGASHRPAPAKRTSTTRTPARARASVRSAAARSRPRTKTATSRRPATRTTATRRRAAPKK